ncbi:MAG: hypothetical protein K0Q87_3250, partial [Neobacillus sp.]|nr:hypothetical protein [Neobacillus sp.]
MAKKYSKENNNIKKESFDGQTSKSSTLHSATSTPAVMPGWMVLPSSVIFILFLALAGSMDNIVEKWMGLFSAILILIVMLFSIRSDNTKQYMNPLFFSLIAYVIWGGISTLYAASGKFAIYEFSKLLFALFIYLFVFHFSGEGEGGFKKISLILAGTGSFFGIISIDAASSNILSNIFKALISFSTDVYEGRGAFEEGIRITGIFGNPNIYAGFMAIAVFLSLYLIISASGKKDRSIAASLLAINALSYLLAFSLGSLFMFMIACFIMIGVSDKGKKAALFIVMVETAVLTFLFAMFSMAGLGKNGVMSFIPLAALILNAVFLYFIDFRLRESLIKRISVNGRFPLKTALLVTFVLVVYIVASFSISSDLKLNSNETIMRAIYVPGGEYTLSISSSDEFNLLIDSQSKNDLIRHSSIRLYTGTNQQDIPFTVPNDSKIVRIYFTSGNEGATIESCSYSGTSNGNVHLNYPLLPNIIANRLQNIFANENMVQRGIFFEDGIKLFSKSPLIGRGLGGYENGI